MAQEIDAAQDGDSDGARDAIAKHRVECGFAATIHALRDERLDLGAAISRRAVLFTDVKLDHTLVGQQVLVLTTSPHTHVE